MNVVLIFRAKDLNYFSIEKVFNTIKASITAFASVAYMFPIRDLIQEI
jgi:hypothetical protein